MRMIFVVDMPGWALDHTADALITAFKAIPATSINMRHVFHKMYLKDFTRHTFHRATLVHFMNWLDGKEYGKLGSGGVCSHNFELKHSGQAYKKMPKMRALTAASPRLYDRIKNMNRRVYYCPNGVDTEKFKPGLIPDNPKFTVGWMGQPTTGGFGEKYSREGVKVWDLKGYELVLRPLMQEMGDKVAWKLCLNTPADAKSYDEIPPWYSDVDVFLCTSLYEGTPLPVLEAAASGKPIISTDVGIVPEILDPQFVIPPPKNKHWVPETVKRLRDALLSMRDMGKERRNAIGTDNRRTVTSKFTWSDVAKSWFPLFQPNAKDSSVQREV